MRIIYTEDYDQMSRKAAGIIAAQVILKPNSVLGLATGFSPVGTYEHLIECYRKGDVDFNRIRTVNLDEYAGLASEHEQSYAHFMRKHFFDRINVDPNNTFIPNGIAEDPDQECRRYDQLIQDLNGVDLQLLGIGPNGHIGFNEPGDYFETGTHIVHLSEATIQANKRFFEREKDVPRYAFTMGIRDIMQAKRVVMIASGKSKAEIISQAFTGMITPHIPASILQLHKDFTLIVDREAGARLP